MFLILFLFLWNKTVLPGYFKSIIMQKNSNYIYDKVFTSVKNERFWEKRSSFLRRLEAFILSLARAGNKIFPVEKRRLRSRSQSGRKGKRKKQGQFSLRWEWRRKEETRQCFVSHDNGIPSTLWEARELHS